MNERYDLNGETIRAWLDKESRKRTYLAHALSVSENLVDKMLAGHVPKERTLKALAALLGVTEQQLLIPRESGAKTA